MGRKYNISFRNVVEWKQRVEYHKMEVLKYKYLKTVHKYSSTGNVLSSTASTTAAASSPILIQLCKNKTKNFYQAGPRTERKGAFFGFVVLLISAFCSPNFFLNKYSLTIPLTK